jgi:hypothetical protein
VAHSENAAEPGRRRKHADQPEVLGLAGLEMPCAAGHAPRSAALGAARVVGGAGEAGGGAPVTKDPVYPPCAHRSCSSSRGRAATASAGAPAPLAGCSAAVAASPAGSAQSDHILESLSGRTSTRQSSSAAAAVGSAGAQLPPTAASQAAQIRTGCARPGASTPVSQGGRRPG